MTTTKPTDMKRVQVSSLPLAVQRALKAAFKATGCMDLYRGDAPTYLNVIASTLSDRDRQIKKLIKACRSARSKLGGCDL